MDFLLTVPYPAPSTLLEVVVSPLPSPTGMALVGGGCARRGFCPDDVFLPLHLAFLFLFLPFSLPPLLSFFLPSCQSLFSFSPECWLVGTSERVPPSNQGTKRLCVVRWQIGYGDMVTIGTAVRS